MICVYKITNSIGQIYVGSTSNYKKRIRYYKSISSRNQKKLTESLKKYGFDNHIFEVIEECELKDLKEREGYWGDYYNVLEENGLNTIIPNCGKRIIGASAEFRKLKSETIKGEKNYWYGKRLPQEIRDKISKARLGIKLSEEHKRKVSLNSAKHKSKIVLDYDTGVYYDSAKEAAFYKNMAHSTLRNKLNGSNPIKVNMAYV